MALASQVLFLSMPKNNRNGQAAILSPQQLNKLFKAMPSSHHRLIFNICRYTTERISAVLKLQISDVYEKKGAPKSIIVFRGSTRKASAGKPGKTREVPVHPRLRELLIAYKVPTETSWLFPNPYNLRSHLSRQAVDEALRRACEKAGLEGMGISTHSFRRTAITELANNGTGIKIIQKITGHASLSQLSAYIEVSERQVEEAINCIL